MSFWAGLLLFLAGVSVGAVAVELHRSGRLARMRGAKKLRRVPGDGTDDSTDETWAAAPELATRPGRTWGRALPRRGRGAGPTVPVRRIGAAGPTPVRPGDPFRTAQTRPVRPAEQPTAPYAATDPSTHADLEPVPPVPRSGPMSVAPFAGPERAVEPGRVGASERLVWLRELDGFGDHLLNRRTNVIGRDESCDVVLADDSVAPRHAVIQEDGDHWTMTAAAPTRAGEMELSEGDIVPLSDGMRLRFGAVRVALLVPPLVEQRSPLVFDAAGRTAVGGRATNQDAHHAGSRIVAVADGVGGRPGGAVASELVVRELLAANPDEPLETAADRINADVRRRGRRDERLSGMATTLDVASLKIDGDGAWVEGLHVGDGLAVIVTENGVEVLTRPHTLAAELVASGRLTSGEGKLHPDRAALLRGIGLAESVSPDIWQRVAEVGHRYMLASDGLLAALGKDGLHRLLVGERSAGPAECADRLLSEAVSAGAPDNVTVVVADVRTDACGSSSGSVARRER